MIKKLGRRLRLGVVGGGPGSFIGGVHRGAALMNEQYDIVAAVLSSNAERSIQAAIDLGIPRGYGSAAEMIHSETNRKDGIDVIAIMTPNSEHFSVACLAIKSGLHVICEKPLTNTLAEAEELERLVAKEKVHFCAAYGYSGYPMVRQAKAMVEAGDIGEIRMIQCDYVQGHLAELGESEKDGSNWHMNSAVAGDDLIVADIGTHCYHLCQFVTQMLPASLSAETCVLTPGRTATDYTSIQLRYDNGARGAFWITQCAAGAEHGLYLRVFGSNGGLEWHQEQPNQLLHRQLGKPARLLTKGGPELYPIANRASKISIGHPEGYREGFATLYSEFAEAIIADITEEDNQNDVFVYPKIAEGVDGVRFINTALESNKKDGLWTSLN